MPVYIALLRGINVVGANQLAMKDLVALCGDCGFQKARTWIQSGNAIFESRQKEDAVKRALEKALAGKMTKPIAVMVRTPAEMRATLEANPFPDKEGSKVAVVFFAGKAPTEKVEGLTGPAGEQVVQGKREIYIYYPEGQGRSKLRLPWKEPGTIRNINTVRKLVELSGG